jgi:uncharacterized protein DUF4189
MKSLFPLVLSCLLLALGATQSYGAWAVALGTDSLPIVGRAYASVSQAKSTTLAGCAARYRNCQIVAAANNTCLALANNSSKTHLRWGVGQGLRRADADQQALATCTALRSGTCIVVHDFCGT